MNPCPHCDGIGQYKDFGICYRCAGTGKLKPTVPSNQSQHYALAAQRGQKPPAARSAEQILRDQEAGRRELAKVKRMLGMQ